MRLIAIFLCLAIVSPAAAQSWGRYANARFSYVVDLPPGYIGKGESDNGDGQAFYRPKSSTELSVWGGHLLGEFADEAANQRDSLSGDGWNLSYRAQRSSWASFSGTKGDRIVYLRLIRSCDGTYAAFKFDYPAIEADLMQSVIGHLTRSLRSSGC